jgi:hypothetical protein
LGITNRVSIAETEKKVDEIQVPIVRIIVDDA